jgi:hypothetical protein
VENKGQINPDFTKISQLLALSQFLSVNPDSNAASALSENEFKLVDSLNKDAKSTETLADRTLRISQTIKNYMENNILVNKVDQLLSDKTVSSHTMQKTFSNLQPIVETK